MVRNNRCIGCGVFGNIWSQKVSWIGNAPNEGRKRKVANVVLAVQEGCRLSCVDRTDVKVGFVCDAHFKARAMMYTKKCTCDCFSGQKRRLALCHTQPEIPTIVFAKVVQLTEQVQEDVLLTGYQPVVFQLNIDRQPPDRHTPVSVAYPLQRHSFALRSGAMSVSVEGLFVSVFLSRVIVVERCAVGHIADVFHPFPMNECLRLTKPIIIFVCECNCVKKLLYFLVRKLHPVVLSLRCRVHHCVLFWYE